ncbi:MAG TPA: GH3 auxin-responsive promoter family protein [Bacteroidales bacterium]|nr:GH3 auxin-responsive promoter family protein [Bacteroidales bacterium]
MPILPSVVRRVNARRLSQIEHFRKNPVETQEKVLLEIVKTAVSTEWGKKYGFSSVSSVEDFQSRVPVRNYEDYLPSIDRLIKGEKDITWPGEIRWFAKSSGTTSAKSKYIPVSRESLWDCHYKAAKDILTIYAVNYPDTKLFSGKALTLGGSNKINQLNRKSVYGDLSALLIWNAPFYAELVRTPSQKIALIEDFEEKLDLITKATVGQNVTSFSGVPSWYLTLIKYVLEYTGKQNLLEVWPNLEAFFHGGISFTPYREIYRKLIPGDQMHYMETYNASEGFFGIQDVPSMPDMLLMLDYGIFYEFIPADESSTGTARAVPLSEVQRGVNYALVISTNGGLWRYMIGDTIVFTSTFPFRFRISGRTKHYINAFGEEVIVDNADKALEAACRATGAVINEYTAGPVYMGETSRGSHEWIIEFEKEPGDIQQFIDVLDTKLKSINSDYEAKRHKDINLVRPVVRPVPAGTFNSWLRSKNKLGGQNKIPRLSNSREFIEELYNFI